VCTPMEGTLPEIAERNRSSRGRLREIGQALSDAELGEPIDPPWTAGALFAHIGFWDRFVLERWRLAADQGERTPMPVDDAVMDRINDASLRQWLAIPARVAVEEFLVAAAELEDLISRLDATIVSQVVTEGRERLVDRSLHRGDHLRTLEEAFPSA
jgi:DinB family protein